MAINRCARLRLPKLQCIFKTAKRSWEEKPSGEKPQKPGILDTVGTFGAIMATVLVGATSPNSVLTWSHWEHGVNGPQAVFRYRIPQETPRFFVGFGYLANDKVFPFKVKSPLSRRARSRPS